MAGRFRLGWLGLVGRSWNFWEVWLGLECVWNIFWSLFLGMDVGKRGEEAIWNFIE